MVGATGVGPVTCPRAQPTRPSHDRAEEDSVIDVLKSYLLVVSGVGQLTRLKAVDVAQQLLAAVPASDRLGEGPDTVRTQVAALAEELLDVGRQQRAMLTELVRTEVETVVARLGLTGESTPEPDDQAGLRISVLEAELVASQVRVRELERELATSTISPPAQVKPSKRARPAKKAAPAKRAVPIKQLAPTEKASRPQSADQKA